MVTNGFGRIIQPIVKDIPRQLDEQTDRGAAIIGGSFVEYFLEQLLGSRMRSLSSGQHKLLFDGFGPLASFSGKIAVAYALNLIGGKARHDLNTVKAIRNKFAHEISGGEWSFSHPWVVDKCNSLKMVNERGFPILPGGGIPDSNTPRGTFIATVYFLSTQLKGEVVANKQNLYSPMFLGD